MTNFLALETSKGQELTLNLKSVAQVQYKNSEHEERPYMLMKGQNGADISAYFESAKDAFNAVAATGEFIRLDGNYKNGYGSSYLIRPEHADYIISSASHESDGQTKRGVIITGQNLYLDGISILEEVYQDLVEAWKKAKGQDNIINVLPNVASARFYKPGEVLIDQREVLIVDSGQSGDTSIDVYFKKTGARIDFYLTKEVRDKLEEDAVEEMKQRWNELAGKVPNWQPMIRNRYMREATNGFLNDLVKDIPHLIGMPVHRGAISFDPSEISAVTKHQRGVSLTLKNKKNTLGDAEQKTIFMDEKQPEKIEKAYQDFVKLLQGQGNAQKPSQLKPKKP